MTEFKRSIVNEFQVTNTLTDENLYWNQYQPHCVISTEAHVSNVSFSPKKPYVLAATSSAKVNFYDASSGDLARTLTRFKQAAYGGCYRQDGALFAVGGAETRVRVFDTLMATKTPLRIFKGHEGSIHHCCFTAGVNHLASYSDDTTVRLWDVGGPDMAEPVVTFRGHTDHIRAGATFHNSPHTIVSASYDHSVRVWDARTGQETMKLMEKKPVEFVLLFQNDRLLVTAAGTCVTVWDLSCGKSLAKLSNHHKTVTSLLLAKDASRLMSAGLDKHVKIYDTTTYKVVHSMKMPAPVLSISISGDNSYFAAGMGGSGLLSILKKEDSDEASLLVQKKKGPTYVPVQELTENKEVKPTVVASKKEPKIPRYDLFLKRFEYNKALNFVLETYKRKPEVIMTVIRELSRRGALETVVAGRDGHYLKLLLQFVINNINEVRYMRPLLGITQLIIDLYGDKASQLDPLCQKLLVALAHNVNQQVTLAKLMSATCGQIELIISAEQSNRKRKHAQIDNSVSL